jgi:non-heme chloroperoxidase
MTDLATTRQTRVAASENSEIARANASGLVPVVFIHGLGLLRSSWDRWAAVFEDAGYRALTPGWPDDPDDVAEANALDFVKRFVSRSHAELAFASARTRF